MTGMMLQALWMPAAALWHALRAHAKEKAMALPGKDGRVDEVVEATYRSESRRVLATLIHLLGDFDRAEEALHDAFMAAVEQWPRDGVPANPRAWLVSAGRFKAVDGIRRRARFDASLADLAREIEASAQRMPEDDAAIE